MTRKKRKAEREAELKATRNAYQRILVQRAAEEAALQNAVTNAVKLRRQLGAYTGAVEAKAFSLPNPGGAAGSKCQPWQCPGAAAAPPQGAPGGSGRRDTLSGRGRATERPAATSAARASRLQSRRSHGL